MRVRWMLAVLGLVATVHAQEPAALQVVVMDPLAKELSCPCVQGYAQRDYSKLTAYLSERLGRPVELTYAESLKVAVETKIKSGRADLVIGKESVVRFDAAAIQRPYRQVASLTGKDGRTTQEGWLVVPKLDPATKVSDLAGYRMIFGPEDCAEKHAAAIALLKKHAVALPTKLETAPGCDVGATAILELPPGERGFAVISSYAAPLLEGCGQVPKGALKIIGKTEPVPFVTAFVSEALPAETQQALTQALLEAGEQPKLRTALETKAGFVAWKSAKDAVDEADVKKN